MRWRGGARKRLFRVRLSGEPERLPLLVGEPPIGELRSAARTPSGVFGIALLPASTLADAELASPAGAVRVLGRCGWKAPAPPRAGA
ncbi:hypothetical protein D6833_02770 [Candidatus Parcubacteria bacterium]|nr:MAG: hypothetical protein D6833_02770 [Candidatus Parcubacteria bacterium]